MLKLENKRIYLIYFIVYVFFCINKYDYSSTFNKVIQTNGCSKKVKVEENTLTKTEEFQNNNYNKKNGGKLKGFYFVVVLKVSTNK